jgi:predicted transposase YbfD/YdcC
LLVSILAIVTGANSFRGIRSFIKTHLKRLNKAFKMSWKRPPAHTATRYILQGFDLADVETIFRTHAANLNSIEATAGKRILAFDGKMLKGSFDAFNDVKARQMLSPFAVDTALVLAHIEIDEKSNEIPAAQKLLEELDVARHIVTLDAMHCQKNIRSRRRRTGASNRSAEGQPADPVPQGRDRLQRCQAAVRASDGRQQKTQPSRNAHRRRVRLNRMAASREGHQGGRTAHPDVQTRHRPLELFI